MRKFFLLLAGLALLHTSFAQSERPRDWKGDLDYLARELPANHYNFFTLLSEGEFKEGIRSIQAVSDDLNDFQVALKTQQLIARFGDSHTLLNFTQLLDRKLMLPIQFAQMSDGLYILHTIREHEEILGSRLLSLNGVPIDTIINKLSTIFTVDNRAMVESRIPPFVPFLQILEYFGFAGEQAVELLFENSDGKRRSYSMKAAEMNRENIVTYQPDSIAFGIKNRSLFFTDFYYPEDKVYYLQYNKCWNRELEQEYGDPAKAMRMPSFKEFEEKAFRTLNTKPVEKILFDLRYNSGGNSAPGSAFIEKLSYFLKENPQIDIYVALGKETFSSAILNALDFKRLTQALFIGEETAGKPNHFGEIRSFQLPASKLQVQYSTKYFKNRDEEVKTLAPDIPVATNFSDFSRGIDPVLDYVRAQ